MRKLVYLIVLIISVASLSALEWKKNTLPSLPFYRLDYDQKSGDVNYKGLDSLPSILSYRVDYDFEFTMKQMFFDLGVDTVDFDNYTGITNPFFNVLFLESFRLDDNYYSHDGGRNWYKSTSEVGKISLTTSYQNHYNTVVGSNFYIAQDREDAIAFTTDSCKSWKYFVHEDYVFFNQLQAANDSTLFYIKQSSYARDSAVYYNINTGDYEGKAIPNHILKWSYDPTVVKGDTIYIFIWDSPGNIYRSTDRGENWGVWFEMSDVFAELYPAGSIEGNEYYFSGNAIAASKKLKDSNGKFQMQYCVSPDFGHTWYFTGIERPSIIDAHCYLKNGDYKKYDLEKDSVSSISLRNTPYGTYRKKDDNIYFQNQQLTTTYIQSKDSLFWQNIEHQFRKKYITKDGREYLLTDDFNLYLNDVTSSALLANVNSFRIISDSKGLEVLSCDFVNDDNEHIVYIQSGQIVDQFELTQEDKYLAGVDLNNPLLHYYLETKNETNLKLITNNISTNERDSIPLNVFQSNDKLVKIFVHGEEIYLVGESHIYLSDDYGESFTQEENPVRFKAPDLPFDNVQLEDGVLYFAGVEGLKMQTKRFTFKNILEDVTGEYVFAVEFVDNKIYAYTEQGLYISDAAEKVSSKPSKRVALYEYRSGIYRSDATEEDKFAQQLEREYPDSLCLITYHPDNIETAPKINEIKDLRTAEADVIVEEIGIQFNNSLVVNRNKYFNLITTVGFEPKYHHEEIRTELEESLDVFSAVNMQVNADVNPETRKLTADVSYYFTSTSVGGHKLSVYLLQDNIKTAMKFKESNPAQIATDGEYLLQNVFRMSLTEKVTGDSIENTSADIMGEKSYTVILPDSIRNTKLDLVNLKVVAFIERDDVGTLNATSSEIEIPDQHKVMLSLEDKTKTSNYIYDYIKPRVEVRNNGKQDVTQFDLHFKFQDKMYSKTVTQYLEKNKSIIVEFDSVKIDDYGNFLYSFWGFENINNSEVTGEYIVDCTPSDNSILLEGLRLQKDAFDYSGFDFEEASSVGYGFDRIGGQNSGMFLYDAFVTRTGIIKLSGNAAEQTDKTVVFHWNDDAGVDAKTSYLLFGEINLTSKEKAFLSYNYALDGLGFETVLPEYEIEYSPDHGKTWELIQSFKPESTFKSESEDYTKNIKYSDKIFVSLKECVGKRVLIRFAVNPGEKGNHFFLDQCEFSDVAPQITSASDRIDFGKITLADGVFEEKSMQFSNIGKEALKIDSVVVYGSDKAYFELVSLFTDNTLFESETDELNIRFSPTKAGYYLANLAIYSNDPENHIYNVRLEGTAVGVSVGEDLRQSERLSISPNPATEYINYSLEGLVEQIEIINLNGKSFNTESNGNQIDISNLSSGTYFLKIKSEGRAFLKQFVVAR